MLDNLSDKFNTVFRTLSGRGRISEENIREAMREVRTALLEADVSFKVVRDFTETVVQKEQVVSEKPVVTEKTVYAEAPSTEPAADATDLQVEPEPEPEPEPELEPEPEVETDAETDAESELSEDEAVAAKAEPVTDETVDEPSAPHDEAAEGEEPTEPSGGDEEPKRT